MKQTSSSQKEAGSARKSRASAVKWPWLRASVRRVWAHAFFVFILLFAGILVFCNIDLVQRWGGLGQRLPLMLIGFGALPLLYPLAKRLGASRTTALWGMALLGASVPWLLLLRVDPTSAIIPFFLTLGIFCYTRVLEKQPGAWVSLGLTLAALFLAVPWSGIGLVLGLGLHAAIWVRQAAQWRPLAWAGALFLAGAVLLSLLPPAGGLKWELAGGWSVARLLGSLVLLNAWVLPWLALPLLWLALFTDPAHRWRVNPEAALPALVVTATVLVAGLSPSQLRPELLLGLAPLAALWIAMGFARLQARTPAWVWMPVGLLLMITAVPQTLGRWSCQAAGVQHLVADKVVADSLTHQQTSNLVPLYPYVSRELTGEPLNLHDI